VTVVCADNLDWLARIADASVALVVTSPPYAMGKEYESASSLDGYVAGQEAVIRECVRVLHDDGSICWQVGHHVQRGEVYPLDALLYPVFKRAGLRLRNRIIWHFEHGLHCSRRLSGRHETILWFTKSDNYRFSADPIRVPQKYPGKKHFKGPRRGELSGNPLGKNPGDVWDIPNVKHNHVEKEDHPCQFPVELIERLVLALTVPGDLVIDPYAGTGSALIAAEKHGRVGLGCDNQPKYVEIAHRRLAQQTLPLISPPALNGS
jgi:adenine-specific DNA-methyltransferase